MSEIYLSSQHIALQTAPRRLRAKQKTLVRHAPPSSNDNSPQWAIENCQKLLTEAAHTGDLRIIFSDLWARYELLALGENELSDADAMALAQAQFSRQYPSNPATAWTLRLARQGKRILVCGIDSALLSALQQLASNAGKRLLRAEPLFAQVFDRYTQELTQTDGWFLLDEPGILLAAFIEQGNLLSLHSQRCNEPERDKTAHQLLERQAALLARPAGAVRIWSYSGAPLVLRQPWHIAHFQPLNLATAEPA